MAGLEALAGLKAKVDQPYRVHLVNPLTDKRLVDAQGKAAYIDVLASDSSVGRAFDEERNRATVKAMRTGDDDEASFDERAADRLAALTVGWHLVDPGTGEAIDYPCTRENAAALYRDAGLGWIRNRVLRATQDVANFMQPPRKN